MKLWNKERERDRGKDTDKIWNKDRKREREEIWNE